jgi:hypothetical protein
MFLLRALLLLLAITVALISAWRLRAPRGVFYDRMLWLLLLAWIVELIGMLTMYFGLRNVVVYNLYAIIEFGVFLHLIQLIRPTWRMALMMAFLIGFAAMTYSFISNGLTHFLALEGLLVIGAVNSLTLLRLLVDLSTTSTEPLGRLPLFWMFTGALLYYGGTIPILGSWQFMGQLDLQLSQFLYWIVVGLAIMRYSFMAMAFQLEYRRRQII